MDKAKTKLIKALNDFNAELTKENKGLGSINKPFVLSNYGIVYDRDSMKFVVK
jgi:hypothetical protein